ncbi:MAG: hypothetical protein A2504_15255 [Bdellovibrionales bacterium RIFOXYD12_FULL_39_22]|nr:MAG: hypothetical protein A2385_02685 [Bdellovibrionales bacterium RIFOXYB1_FULL_39_21]OFZ43153.1 MAG: hypothetical protein A2485_11830 [Bdellovibrionales bacterium RIFOXYC12_FULL_39_17]OFZ47891.1 MAG: hypothetical protein A2404_16470 [Bdellovibrionales bacterium RIFOXYC1_FULL_39_130]OFZ74837.1 MAG: hypothetical protein A2451_03290 [Bdellovibrionales bacterium RIFOXYC2_FULL_39_8]OFZ75671.1 MAG: hypothetical protein A2560_12970 [Bdellovibrionales bacterium RIFOXYD1_FULL_39_84]OFZ94161.1 MAG:
MFILALTRDELLQKLFSSFNKEEIKILLVETTKAVKDNLAAADILFLDLDFDSAIVSKVREQCVGQGNLKTITCSVDAKNCESFRKEQCKNPIYDGHLQKPLNAEIVLGVISDFKQSQNAVALARKSNDERDLKSEFINTNSLNFDLEASEKTKTATSPKGGPAKKVNGEEDFGALSLGDATLFGIEKKVEERSKASSVTKEASVVKKMPTLPVKNKVEKEDKKDMGMAKGKEDLSFVNMDIDNLKLDK